MCVCVDCVGGVGVGGGGLCLARARVCVCLVCVLSVCVLSVCVLSVYMSCMDALLSTKDVEFKHLPLHACHKKMKMICTRTQRVGTAFFFVGGLGT